MKLCYNKIMSNQLQNMDISQTLKMNEKITLFKQQKKQIYQFGFGQSPFPVPPSMNTNLINNSSNNKYLPVQGIKELRNSIANFYEKYTETHINADNIIIGPGSKELLFLFSIIYDSDIILPDSCWVSYSRQAIINQKQIIWYRSCFEDNWKIIPAKLDKLLENSNDTSQNKRNKYLILNSPCNPTGQVYTDRELKDLAIIAAKHNLIIISDEIYSEFSFVTHTSIAKYYNNTIICSGISKFLSCGGWRLGFMIFPDNLRNLLKSMCNVASESYSCVCSPVQYASIIGFKSPEIIDYITSCREILKEVALYVYNELTKKNNDIIVHKSEGGFYIFPIFTNTPKAKVLFTEWDNKYSKSSTQFSKWVFNKLFDETGIAVLPGVEFGRSDSELSCRLAYIDFDGGLLLDKYQNEPLNRDFIIRYCPNIVKGVQLLIDWWK